MSCKKSCCCGHRSMLNYVFFSSQNSKNIWKKYLWIFCKSKAYEITIVLKTKLNCPEKSEIQKCDKNRRLIKLVEHFQTFRGWISSSLTLDWPQIGQNNFAALTKTKRPTVKILRQLPRRYAIQFIIDNICCCCCYWYKIWRR